MTFTCTVDGLAVDVKEGSLRISQTANGRATASFTVISIDRSWRPNLRDEVIMSEDSSVIFGGVIERITEKGTFKGSHPGIQLVISAVDYNVYAERRYVAETIPAGTLKAALQAIEPYLATYGVTLDAGQVNGPNLPDLVYDYVRLDEVLNQFATLTADFGEPYVWDINASRELSMFQPSTVAAPFNLVGNDLPEVIGDIEVDTQLNPGYANKIIIKLAPQTQIAHVESFTGDGVTSVWTLQYTLIKDYGYVTDDTGTSPVTNKTLTTTPFQGTADWTYHPATNTLERDLGPLPNGQVAEFKFDGVFSGIYTATDPEFAYDPWERVIVLESIPNGTTGQAFADAELAKRLTETKTARYSTWEQGVAAGQSQTINVSARATNAAAMISEVEIRDLVHRLDRRVTTITDDARTNLDRGWRQVYKDWLGDKSGTGVTTTAGSSASVGPALPDESVQSNQGGAFYGKASFLFKAAGDSVVIGEGSDITAANFSSCFIAGRNCTIADP
jgi:hypothetical protein